MNNFKKRSEHIPRWGAVLLCVLTISGCGAKEQNAAQSGRDTNTIRCDLAMYQPGLIPEGIGKPNSVALDIKKEWEQLHPGRKIDYPSMAVTGGGEGEWLKTQLLGGIAPEIIEENCEIAWPDVDKGWYVPLDEYIQRPNPYVPGNEHWMDIFESQALIEGKRAPNGKLYCIPVDIVETGWYYNKTLLNQLGIQEMPKTWQEMIEMFDKIRSQSDVIPMCTWGPVASDWGQDIIFDMLYRDILADMDFFPASKESEARLGNHLEQREVGFLFTKGFFTTRDPRWREMYRLLRQLREYWPKELRNTDPTRLFLTGRAAIYWSGSWFLRRMSSDPYVNFDWDVAYFPTITQESSPFGPGTPACVVGGGGMQYHITNSAKINNNLDDCVDYLMFLTAPQNIGRLTGETFIYIPFVKGIQVDERFKPFQDIYMRRYCAIKWLESFDGRYKKDWRRMLDYFLNDGTDLDGYLATLEGIFKGWVETHKDEGGWNFSEIQPIWEARKDRLERELLPE